MQAFTVIAGLSLLAAAVIAVALVTTAFLTAMARLERAAVSEPAPRRRPVPPTRRR